MTTPLAHAKSILRAQMRARWRGLPAVERASGSAQLCALFAAEKFLTEAQTFLCFSPLPDEPDITPLFDELWASGRTLALPRFDAASGAYAPCRVTGREELVAGRFGVLEPGPACPLIPLNQLDFTFVPGVAFDLEGRRLGRGKGFYDRLLAGVRGHKCGVALEAQLVTEVPEEPHDVRVDSILTPTRWHWCRCPV